MSIRRSLRQPNKNSTLCGKNITPKNVQKQPSKSLKNTSKQLDKTNSIHTAVHPEVEATTSVMKSCSNGLTDNLTVALESKNSRKKSKQSEQAASPQQPIKSASIEKKLEIALAEPSSKIVSTKLRRGKSWIDSNDDKYTAEQLAKGKTEESKGFKRSSSLGNKILKSNQESKKLNKENPKKKTLSATDEAKKENAIKEKVSMTDVTIASAECKPKQKFACQERSSSAESTATQILSTELHSTKDQLIPEKSALLDKSYTIKPQLVLYFNILSPQARSCLMLMNFLNLDLDLRYTDHLTCQQLSEDFQKINAWHTVPKLVHNDVVLTDSHTILMYLCVTFSSPQAQQLFPSCPVTRLKIMNILFFEAQVLFRRYSNYMTDIVRKEFGKIDCDLHRNKIFEAYEILNGYLKSSQFLVGDTLTLADISVVATFSSLDLMFPIDFYKDIWPQLADWFHFMREMPMYLPNNTGVKKQRDIIRSFGKCILLD